MVPKQALSEWRVFLSRAPPEGDASGRSQRLINHNCFNSVNDVSEPAAVVV